jgi:tetratricopeptide (TPR) repeat protein
MSDSTADRDPIERLADSFLARFRRGERPSAEEYVAQHPELADEIRELLPALVMLEQEKPVAGAATGTNGGPAAAAGPAPNQLGDYLILRELGRGGMGVVYEAVQQSLGRHVALKVLPRQALAGSSQVERFRLEARAAARLHHTNIVPVFGVGECEGVHYYAMQFIQGQGLDVVIDALRGLRDRAGPISEAGDGSSPKSTGGDDRPLTAVVTLALLTGRFASPPEPEREPMAGAAETGGAHGAPPPHDPAPSRPSGSPPSGVNGSSELSSSQAGAPYYRSVARVGVQVAEALAHAHGQGILHRDIKPSNLLLDVKGTVWITDFGLAKAEGSDRLTQTGDIVGTLRYMAPERFDGWSDPRSDVYSLGATLYELLSLRPPFQESDRVKLIEQVLHAEPTAPRKLDRQVPRDLETLVLKALAKEPGQRYTTAEQMAEDLRRFAADRPILARRITPAERTWRWCKRNPGLAAANIVAATLMMILALGATIAAWIYRHQRNDLRVEKALTEASLRRAERAEGIARAEGEHARESAAEAEAVLKFFQDQVLAAGRPEGQQGGLGKDVTLRQAVDAAEPRIAAAFRDRPLIEASVRTVLGDTYRYLGEWDQAVRQYERALVLRKLSLGPDHPASLTTQESLVSAAGFVRGFDQTLALSEQTVAARKAALGPDHPDTLTSQNTLASLYQETGQLDRAIRLFQETLARRIARSGPNDPATLLTQNDLGGAYLYSGKYEQAIPLFERTLDARRAALGPDHPDTLTTENDLAITYDRDGQPNRAIPLLEHNVKLSRAKLGPDHSDTLTSQNNLAETYRNAGQIDRALSLLEQTLKNRKGELGSDHLKVLHTQYQLGKTYRAKGLLDQAVALLERTLGDYRTRFGRDYIFTLRCQTELAITCRERGDLARAESLLREAVALRRGKFGRDNPELATALAELGLVQINESKWIEAEPFLRECLKIREAGLPDKWPRFDAQSLLGACLIGQRKYAEAEPLIVQGYEGMVARWGRIPFPERKRLADAAERIVQLYEAWGKTQKAAEWRARLAPATDTTRPEVPDRQDRSAPGVG